MESQEEGYKHKVWEMYRREWEAASREKRFELNNRMLHWQELIKSGLSAEQAYRRAMEEESGKSTRYSFQSWMRKAPFLKPKEVSKS